MIIADTSPVEMFFLFRSPLASCAELFEKAMETGREREREIPWNPQVPIKNVIYQIYLVKLIMFFFSRV